MALKYCIIVAKGSKSKVRKFLGLTLTFVEVTGEKLIGGTVLDQEDLIYNLIYKMIVY